MSTWNQNMSLKWCLIAVDFQERWLDRCKCSLVKSSRFSWGKSFTQGGCYSVKRSMPLSSVLVSTLSLYFVIILITSSIQDTSRSIQLATAPNEALQEVFTVIGSVRQIFFSNFGLLSQLAWWGKPFFLWHLLFSSVFIIGSMRRCINRPPSF